MSYTAMCVALVAIAAVTTHTAAVAASTVTLSNTQLPRDTDGNLLRTGEADVLVTHGATELPFVVYFNDWDPCVYTYNHTVVAYETDLSTWRFLGEVLPPSRRKPGIEFRPHVVYNKATAKYVMWYEDRWAGQTGYAVATAPTPSGPFTTVSNTTNMASKTKIGDFDILVDGDSAYLVRTGFSVEQLDGTFTRPSGKFVEFTTPAPAEGPVFFKRNGVYYILPGRSCCACRGGSNVYVFTGTDPMGPYTLRGDVGSNTTGGHVFDPHSPYNFVTHAQASKAFAVNDHGDVLWMGNQWVTATEAGQPRDHDLLYWTLLNFTADGNITQFEHSTSCTVFVG